MAMGPNAIRVPLRAEVWRAGDCERAECPGQCGGRPGTAHRSADDERWAPASGSQVVSLLVRRRRASARVVGGPPAAGGTSMDDLCGSAEAPGSLSERLASTMRTFGKTSEPLGAPSETVGSLSGRGNSTAD